MSTTTNKTKLRNFINLVSFVAMVFIGLTLLVNSIWRKNPPAIITTLKLIADVISYSLVAYFSFNFARGKRHWAYMLAWAIAVALIAVFILLPLVLPA